MTYEYDHSLISEKIFKTFLKYVENEGITVDEIVVKAGSNKGDNYLGIIAQADVKGTDQDGKQIHRNFVIKSAPKVEILRNIMCIPFAYKREIMIYNYILPEFNKFQTEKKLKNVFKSYATCYETMDESNEEALILQDMKALGYKMQNRKKPLDYFHVKLVIHELARYHSLSFALKDQQPSIYMDLKNSLDSSLVKEMIKSAPEDYSIQQNQRALKTLNPETDQYAIERFEKYMENSWNDMKDIVSADTEPYCIIRHGDCWTNNFLFAYKDKTKPEVPTDLCFLDFQLSNIASPVLDILYFINTCTDKQLRDNHFNDLLKYYHKTMKNFTAELGSDIEKLYPYNIMEEQLKKFGRYGLSVAVSLLYLLSSEGEEIPDINEVFKNSNLEEIKEAFQYETRNVDEYNVRMRDLILDAVKMQFI